MAKKTKILQSDISIKDDGFFMSLNIKLPKSVTKGFKLREVDDAHMDDDGLYLFFSLEPKEK